MFVPGDAAGHRKGKLIEGELVKVGEDIGAGYAGDELFSNGALAESQSLPLMPVMRKNPSPWSSGWISLRMSDGTRRRFLSSIVSSNSPVRTSGCKGNHSIRLSAIGIVYHILPLRRKQNLELILEKAKNTCNFHWFYGYFASARPRQ